MTSIKSYSKLITLPTFVERFRYLKLDGVIGEDTFGYDRYLNQLLYQSKKWKRSRRDVIIRDLGCDLACEGFEIPKFITVHHMNPISVEDIIAGADIVFDPENLITTSDRTHRAIHYGDESLLVIAPTIRTRNDTCPWKN